MQLPVSVQYLVLGTLALYFSQYFQLNIYSLFSHFICTSLYNAAGGLPSQSVDVLLSDSSTLHLTSENRRMAWHKGSWWPLFVKEWYAPKSSQYMFDPYSFCLIVLGLIFHLLWGTDDIDYWIFGFLAALLLELVLEIVGNSQFILERIRKNSGTSGEYIGKTGQGGNILKLTKKNLSGDSVQNIIGDIFSVGLGYILGTVFLAVELWWLSILWTALSEVKYFQ